MNRYYNLENIQFLLAETFTDEEVRCLCYDIAEFNPVYKRLTRNSDQADVIKKLVQYAEQTSKLEKLLSLAEKHNLVAYEKYQPYHSNTPVSAPIIRSKPQIISAIGIALSLMMLVLVAYWQFVWIPFRQKSASPLQEAKEIIPIITVSAEIPAPDIDLGTSQAITQASKTVDRGRVVKESISTPTPTSSSIPTPTEMSALETDISFPEDKLGVIVAYFGESTDFKESAKGQDISETIYRTLNEQMRLAGLRQVIVKLLKTTISSEVEAKKLGGELQATIVVWGYIGSDSETLFPNFTLLGVLDVANSIDPTDLSTYLTPLGGSQTLQLGEKLSNRVSVLSAFILGLTYMLDRNYDQAVIEFSKAIDLAGDQLGADVLYDYRARAYIGLWDFEKAREDFKHALNLNKNNPSLYIGLASIYYNDHSWDQATQMYEKALKIQPDYIRAYQGLGAVQSIQGNHQNALQYYKKVIEVKEDDVLARYSLGVILYKLGHIEEAIEAFEKSLKYVGANKKLKAAIEQNLLLAKQLLITTPTFTASSTQPITPVPFSTSTPVVLPTITSPLKIVETIDSTLFHTDTTTLYSAPILQEPPDGLTIIGGYIRFSWDWSEELGADEYFDLKIRPLGSPDSVFVAWSKEPEYIFDAYKAPLEESRTYIWTVQILRGHYDGQTKVLESFLSPESDGFTIHRGTEHPIPDDSPTVPPR